MFLSYFIALLSIILYLHGFFPIPARPLQNTLPNNVTDTHPKYKKAVIIVIDALRLDFVTDNTTPFLSSSYKNYGCFIHLKVATPTVTLPRIKALTTGNIPQFVDIIFNLASPTKVEDSFIHQAHAKGKKIVFYGDDIWVKLFPEEFIRSEGTSSFFVNDFTEVDNNVTRNVKLEKNKTDWDIMILHYLGLDHIGHVYGPKSPLILQKLKEMDSIISEIQAESENGTLIIVTGDHGMRDSGGHGGSTYSETNVPLVVLGMPCVNDTFAQIDIPANLAILLGFDIPTTSIGQLQESLLSHLPLATYLQASKYNALLLKNKINLCEENIETANHLHELYLLSKDEKLANDALRIYQNCVEKMSEKLKNSSVHQKLGSLLIATVTAITVLLKILQSFSGTHQVSYIKELIMFGILVLQFIELHSDFIIALVIGSLFLCFQSLWCLKVKYLELTNLSFLTYMSIIHPFSFLSSSFLEEEHQFWYFFINTFIVFNCVTDKVNSKKWFLLFVALRFIRTINQVGDKWAALPDLADWLSEKENYVFLQLIFSVGLILSFSFCFSHTKYRLVKLLDVMIFICIYIYRINENVILGQMLWLLICVKFAHSVVKKEDFLNIWIVTINLLLKPQNVILIPVGLFASELFHKSLNTENLVMAHWWLGNLLFFAQGHDNSLASVDISSGYIGLTQYNPFFVFPQVLCHTYALPVLSHLLLFSKKKVDTDKIFATLFLLRLYIVVVTFIVTFVHRYHLFVWSVFAPKIFVESSHFGFLIIEMCCYYCVRIVINK